MITPTTFLTIVIAGVQSLQWVDIELQANAAESDLPNNVAVVYPNTNQKHYFCRVKNQNSNTQEFIVGHMKGVSGCKYPNAGQSETSQVFQILVEESDDILDWKYIGRGKPHSQAVPCDLITSGGDCYLGQSVYSDGICIEQVGFINTRDQLVVMAYNQEVRSCPFFSYFINEKTN